MPKLLHNMGIGMGAAPDGSEIVLTALQNDNGKPNQPRGIMILPAPH